jgi:hypothetical protein
MKLKKNSGHHQNLKMKFESHPKMWWLTGMWWLVGCGASWDVVDLGCGGFGMWWLLGCGGSWDVVTHGMWRLFGMWGFGMWQLWDVVALGCGGSVGCGG